MRRSLIFVVSMLCLLALLPGTGFAQLTSGDLTGNVLDATGAAVPDARVEALNVATGVRTVRTTDTNGTYRFSNLPIGTYDINVTAQGFNPTSVRKVAIELNKVATANVTVSVGTVSTTVEVTDAGATVDTTTAQIQTTYNTTMSADLPVASIGQGVLNLSLLNAGVTNAGAVGAGTGPSVGGQRPRNNNFTIEGIDNNSKVVTGPLVFIPNDSVSEFTLLQNQFSPEYGHSSGGQFNTNIKSGTNELHGSIYDYLQNRNLNAVDVSNKNQGVFSNPRYDQNRLGATIGGAIIKNKLFYFGSFEYNPLGQASNPSSAVYTPTAAGYSTLASIPGVSQTNLSIFQKYATAAPSATGDPLTYTDSATNRTFTVPIGILPLTSPNYTNSYYGIASADYNMSDKDQLRGRFIYNKISAIDTAATLPQFYTPQPNTYYLTTLTEYHNFSPSVTNELRLGYNRYNQNFPAGNFQFPGLDAFPNLQFNELNLQIGPDPNAPQFTVQNMYQLTDNLTWVKGSHTIKFGFDGRKFISPQSFTQRGRGDYEYSSLFNYLTDQVPDDLSQRSLGSPIYYGDQIMAYSYINDTWKIRPNFSLNLGLRHEYTTVPFSERSQVLNRYAGVPGLLEFKEPKPQTTNFAPRVGIAYSPGTSGNTSIRAGFGINYDQIFDNIGILSLPPQLSTTVDNTGGTGTNFLKNGGIPLNTASGPLSVDDARAATAGYIPDQKLPYSIQWNFGIQHVFASNYTFEARYVGTRGVHLDVQQRINIQSPVTPQNQLPTFYSRPSQAQLNALTTTLASLSSVSNVVPAFENAGFTNSIVENAPIGNSIYHGLALQLNRRFSNGLQFIGAYTWSHNIDDSTADFFSTVLTPRRPQDFQNLRVERASSALDRRHRFTFTAVYDLPLLKTSSNWFAKNLIGNWELAPIYTYESPEYATVQSAQDSNLNGDTWGDRSIINPNGQGNTSSDVTALKNSAGDIVGYLANDPSAKYIRAGKGTYPNGGRNTLAVRPINDVDLTLVKRFNFTERTRLELMGQFSNLLNHPQYTGGFINRVDASNPALTAITTSIAVRNYLTPGNALFNRPDLVFSSNPRSIQVVAKFIF